MKQLKMIVLLMNVVFQNKGQVIILLKKIQILMQIIWFFQEMDLIVKILFKELREKIHSNIL